MRRTPLTHLTALALAGALGLSGCGSQSAEGVAEDPSTSMATESMTTESTEPTESMTPEPTESMATAEVEAMAPGAYLTLAEYRTQMAQREGTTVVYFFHAPWCPTCRATEESVSTDGVPTGLTIVKIDYDSETDLRQQYGITQQHTFVQVDPDGNALAKWTGSTTAAEIKAETV
jgi:thioredoxin 1